MTATNGSDRKRLLILGAAGRDYHTFNTQYRTDPHVQVVGFTHAQASHICQPRQQNHSMHSSLVTAGTNAQKHFTDLRYFRLFDEL